MKKLQDTKIDIRIKLSALWAALMFVYVYVDIISIHKPGSLANTLEGNMGPFPATETSLFIGLALLVIPALMVFLPLVLKPIINKWLNIILAGFYILVSIGSAVGEYMYYWFGASVETILLILIIYFAAKWPKK